MTTAITDGGCINSSSPTDTTNEPAIDDSNYDWKKLHDLGNLPDVNDLTAEEALGFLNQSLVNLILVHDHLPTELDMAAAIVKGEMKEEDIALYGLSRMDEDDHHHHHHELRHSPHEVAVSDTVSPLDMTTKNSPSTAGSPEPSLGTMSQATLNRRRRRSSVLVAEATAVAEIVNQTIETMPELRGRALAASELTTEEEVYKSAISRRFWSKSPPDISTWKYLSRIHHYCPSSTAVYLATAVYIYRLCVVTKTIPLTTLCVHRLVLAAMRIAQKMLEDNNHTQKRYAMVGGVSPTDLYRLEIALLFLVDFDIKVDAPVLQQSVKYIAELDQSVRKHERLSNKRSF